MIVEKSARETLTAVELDLGDELRFTLATGETRRVVLKGSWARVFQTTLSQPRVELEGAVTNYRFSCTLQIDGTSVTLVREVATHCSFYEPREAMGLRICSTRAKTSSGS